MERNGLTEAKAVQARERYVQAWNKMMIDIWQEQIALLDVIDTGALLSSTVALPVRADGRFLNISLSQEFNTYGLWQNYGTGRETPRKGRKDAARYRDADGSLINDKARQAKPWFSKKYFASVMAIRDFLAESIGEEFIGMVSDVFNDRALKARY